MGVVEEKGDRLVSRRRNKGETNEMYMGRSAVAASGLAVGTLPFTGLNVMWLVLAGVTLFTTGVALVRLAR
jgi:hypothetical protein